MCYLNIQKQTIRNNLKKYTVEGSIGRVGESSVDAFQSVGPGMD